MPCFDWASKTDKQVATLFSDLLCTNYINCHCDVMRPDSEAGWSSSSVFTASHSASSASALHITRAEHNDKSQCMIRTQDAFSWVYTFFCKCYCLHTFPCSFPCEWQVAHTAQCVWMVCSELRLAHLYHLQLQLFYFIPLALIVFLNLHYRGQKMEIVCSRISSPSTSVIC